MGVLAQRRLSRGIKLNQIEANALISYVLQEKIRDGSMKVSELMAWGKKILGFNHVMGQVPGLLHEIMVEGTFLDGTFLVTVHEPICTPNGDLRRAMLGSGLPTPSSDVFEESPTKVLHGAELPGAMAVKQGAGPIVLAEGRERVRIKVTNTGDRPVQVGSRE